MMKMTKGLLKKAFLLSLAVIFGSAQLLAQKVTGVIVDESNSPIPGVSVIVKGTTIGTISDIDGSYSLSNVPENASLIFSFIGMRAQEIKVGTNTKIDVALKEESIGLDEVIAIGYGTVKKRDLTGTVSSVSSEQITAAPVADVAQALKGKISGVTVTSQDGRPGADISIRVRGVGSITNSNDPLYIVDGFRVNSISNIPASQIQSIDVLKDASTTAIYGASGANGVIMVTTKSGSSGKTTVTYDGYMQYNKIPDFLDVMNGYDYIAFNWAYADAIGSQYSDAWERMWAIGRFEGSNTQGINFYKNVNSRDFTKELYNDSFTHNHNVSITSGTDKTKFLLALNHLDQEGNKVGSSYKRTNVQLKLDQALGSKLTLTLNTRFINVQKGDNEGNSTAYWFRPIATKDVLGDMDVTSNTQLGDYNSILQDVYNPVSQIEDSEIDSNERSLVGNTAISWEIVKGLTAKSDLGLSTNWDRTKKWSGAIVNNYLTPDGTPTFGGDAEIKASEGWQLRWVNTLNYDIQVLGPDHKINILGGYEVSDSHSENTEIKGNQYPISFDAERAWANMNSFTRSAEYENFSLAGAYGTANRSESYFGRFNYTLKDRYLFTGTFRADGSSRFAEGNRWGYFPAAAVAWRISDESFMQSATWLDNMKLRLSVGAVGNDNIGFGKYKQPWKANIGTYSIDEIRQPIYETATNEIANPNITWETTITRNIGLDFAVFNSRLSGTIEVYNNSVNDLLLTMPVPEITGFGFTQENIASTSNKGVELALNGDIVRSNDFNLRASFNINFNRNNVEELTPLIDGKYSSGFGGVRLNPQHDYYLEVGKPIGMIRGYQHEGWYTTSDFNYDAVSQIYTIKEDVADVASGILPNVFGTTANKPGSQTAYPGVQRLKDINGPDGIPDGIIDDFDIGVIGDTNPKHTGGFSLSGNYKNIDFGLDFDWSFGNDIYNATHVEAYLGGKESGLYRNRFQELAGHYKIYDIVDGQLTKVVEPAALDALNANATTYLPYPESAVMSTFGVEDGSFLRLNTVTLGYTLPNNLLSKIKIERLRLYGTIYNALTWTSYGGFDPEVNVGEDRNSSKNGGYPTPGMDYGSYPRARSFTLGVNIEF